MARKYVLKLMPEERSGLEFVARGTRGRRSIAAWKVQRAQVLLKCDQGEQGPGWPDHRIAAAFGATERSIQNWRKKAVLDGPMSALERKPRLTPPTSPRLDGEGEAKLVQLACSAPPARSCSGRDRFSPPARRGPGSESPPALPRSRSSRGTEAAASLPRHADRLHARLFERGRIEDNHASVVPQFDGDLPLDVARLLRHEPQHHRPARGLRETLNAPIDHSTNSEGITMTDDNALAARLERLERLERQNRRMKRIGIATIAVAGVAFLLGAQGDKPEVLSEIRVKKLVVVDKNGIDRGYLGVDDNGHTRLDMNDQRGGRRIILLVHDATRRAQISFHQSDGKMRIGGGCEDGGTAWMNTLNTRGRTTNGVSSKP